MWHGHFGMFPFFWGGWGFLILILVIWVIFRGFWGSCHYPIVRSNDSHREDALETLKKRYAKGEISKAEYQEMQETLKG